MAYLLVKVSLRPYSTLGHSLRLHMIAKPCLNTESASSTIKVREHSLRLHSTRGDCRTQLVARPDGEGRPTTLPDQPAGPLNHRAQPVTPASYLRAQAMALPNQRF